MAFVKDWSTLTGKSPQQLSQEEQWGAWLAQNTHFDDPASFAGGLWRDADLKALNDPNSSLSQQISAQGISPQFVDQWLAARNQDRSNAATADQNMFGGVLAAGTLGLAGAGAFGGLAGGAAAPAAGDAGVTVGSLANTAAPEVIGTATGAGQFVNAAGAALPAMAGVAPELAAGSMAGGVFAPAAQGAMTGGAAATGGSALGRLLGLGQTGQDVLSVGGAVAPSVLGMIGSNQQTKALEGLAGQYMAMGEPYRQQLSNISNDPNAFFQGQPAQLATDAVLRKLSAGGNPAGNPYSQAQAINALWNEYGKERDRLAGFGGLTQYNQAAPQAGQNAIGAQGQIYNQFGGLLGNVLNPPKQQTLADIFKGATI